jgi:hypothetical protein
MIKQHKKNYSFGRQTSGAFLRSNCVHINAYEENKILLKGQHLLGRKVILLEERFFF